MHLAYKTTHGGGFRAKVPQDGPPTPRRLVKKRRPLSSRARQGGPSTNRKVVRNGDEAPSGAAGRWIKADTGILTGLVEKLTADYGGLVRLVAASGGIQSDSRGLQQVCNGVAGWYEYRCTRPLRCLAHPRRAAYALLGGARFREIYESRPFGSPE